MKSCRETYVRKAEIKGRDIFDLWYLRTVLNTAADREMIERKFRMYAWPFQAARTRALQNGLVERIARGYMSTPS